MRQVGSIFPYQTKFSEDGPDITSACYAIEWNKTEVDSDLKGRVTSQLLGPLDSDVCNWACMATISPEEYASLEQKMKDIMPLITGSPWFIDAPYLEDQVFRGGNIEIDYRKNVIIVEDWAFTGNSLQYNNSNPAQAYNSLKFLFSPGVTSVEFKISRHNGSGEPLNLIVNSGQEVGLEELQSFFDFGPLPQPILTTCQTGELEDEKWPILQNVVDDTYPWGHVGKYIDLQFEVVKINPEGAESTSSTNAYYDALSEEFK